MISKTDQLRGAWHRGDKIGALRIAARFFDASPETDKFKIAWDALQNRLFYLQIGKDPDALLAAGLDALASKFGL